MELLGVLIMIGAGIAIAMTVVGALVIHRAESNRDTRDGSAGPGRDEIAASLLFHVLIAGGEPNEDALKDIRRAGLAARVTRAIDAANWGEVYAQRSSPPQRESLLDTAVRLVAARHRQVPLLQYVALLDLSFALGFQTDALAKLRSKYGFEYVDHAKDARPREADRGGRTSFFERGEGDEHAWLALLEIDGIPSRQAIISAYRRLAAQHHPDRFHEASSDVQSAAAARFIELTQAYESLLARYGD